MRVLPVCFAIKSGIVALVGSGPAAVAKLRLLRAAGATVRWFSLSLDVTEEALLASRPPGRLELAPIDPLAADLSDCIAVVSAANGPLDAAVAARARSLNLPVNVVDRPSLSTFTFPAIVDRGDVVVAIEPRASPVVARRLREEIEALLPSRLGQLVASTAASSRAVRGGAPRQRVVPALLGAGDRRADRGCGAGRPHPRGRGGARPGGRRCGAAAGETERHGISGRRRPGRSGIADAAALRLLQEADVVIHDRLIGPRVLDYARRDADRIDVGKAPGHHAVPQDEINAPSSSGAAPAPVCPAQGR